MLNLNWVNWPNRIKYAPYQKIYSWNNGYVGKIEQKTTAWSKKGDGGLQKNIPRIVFVGGGAKRFVGNILLKVCLSSDHQIRSSIRKIYSRGFLTVSPSDTCHHQPSSVSVREDLTPKNAAMTRRPELLAVESIWMLACEWAQLLVMGSSPFGIHVTLQDLPTTSFFSEVMGCKHRD